MTKKELKKELAAVRQELKKVTNDLEWSEYRTNRLIAKIERATGQKFSWGAAATPQGTFPYGVEVVIEVVGA